MIRMFRIAFIMVFIFVMAYLFVSWIDVIGNNIGNGSHFQPWNFFQILFGKYLH